MWVKCALVWYSQPLTSIFGWANSSIKKMRLECCLHPSHSMLSSLPPKSNRGNIALVPRLANSIVSIIEHCRTVTVSLQPCTLGLLAWYWNCCDLTSYTAVKHCLMRPSVSHKSEENSHINNNIKIILIKLFNVSFNMFIQKKSS